VSVHDVLHALAGLRGDDEELDGAVVVGFAAAVEWMTPDGTKWLCLQTGDAAGQELQRWQVQGYLFNVLHDPAWHEDDGDD
jgi:hypothetical protein